MKLALTGRHVEITPALRQLIERRLVPLERLMNDSLVSAQVILTREKYRYRTELVVHARGDRMLSGLGEATTWPASVRLAVDKIEQQAQKVKGKWDDRKRRGTSLKAARPTGSGGAASSDGAAEEAAPTAPIVRATRYAVKPMSLEDAATRVEATNEAFVVFRSTTDEAVKILFRRADGKLGLIEPD